MRKCPVCNSTFSRRKNSACPSCQTPLHFYGGSTIRLEDKEWAERIVKFFWDKISEYISFTPNLADRYGEQLKYAYMIVFKARGILEDNEIDEPAGEFGYKCVEQIFTDGENRWWLDLGYPKSWHKNGLRAITGKIFAQISDELIEYEMEAPPEEIKIMEPML